MRAKVPERVAKVRDPGGIGSILPDTGPGNPLFAR